ncbi:General transcription factor II-I repeat domain-containing protein 2A [Eumeta japonica]|uniref:General transcription factor II-I repeat domain-containing protein 2A n=1 Tax=Eumeta variegata TaxID=151549 RepID=A0A4C1UBV0_EUMVA|nr:General transcription factor II-I repeat domain-containing protein 2A [Eumeta japonica]
MGARCARIPLTSISSEACTRAPAVSHDASARPRMINDQSRGFRSLDKSTDLSDTAQLAIFIRGVDKEFTVTKELFVLQPLKGTTTGEDIFNQVQKNKIRLWEAQMLSGNSYHFTTVSAYENFANAQYAKGPKLLSE